jgi:hypothetical protein
VALAEQRDMIRDSTLFHWWPRLRAKWSAPAREEVISRSPFDKAGRGGHSEVPCCLPQSKSRREHGDALAPGGSRRLAGSVRARPCDQDGLRCRRASRDENASSMRFCRPKGPSAPSRGRRGAGSRSLLRQKRRPRMQSGPQACVLLRAVLPSIARCPWQGRRQPRHKGDQDQAEQQHA